MKETGPWKSEGISSEFGAHRPQTAVKPRSRTNNSMICLLIFIPWFPQKPSCPLESSVLLHYSSLFIKTNCSSTTVARHPKPAALSPSRGGTESQPPLITKQIVGLLPPHSPLGFWGGFLSIATSNSPCAGIAIIPEAFHPFLPCCRFSCFVGSPATAGQDQGQRKPTQNRV